MIGKQSPERAETCPCHTADIRVNSKTRSSLQMPALTLALAFWVFLEGTHMPIVGCCQTENFSCPACCSSSRYSAGRGLLRNVLSIQPWALHPIVPPARAFQPSLMMTRVLYLCPSLRSPRWVRWSLPCPAKDSCAHM